VCHQSGGTAAGHEPNEVVVDSEPRNSEGRKPFRCEDAHTHPQHLLFVTPLPCPLLLARSLLGSHLKCEDVAGADGAAWTWPKELQVNRSSDKGQGLEDLVDGTYLRAGDLEEVVTLAHAGTMGRRGGHHLDGLHRRRPREAQLSLEGRETGRTWQPSPR